MDGVMGMGSVRSQCASAAPVRGGIGGPAATTAPRDNPRRCPAAAAQLEAASPRSLTPQRMWADVPLSVGPGKAMACRFCCGALRREVVSKRLSGNAGQSPRNIQQKKRHTE